MAMQKMPASTNFRNVMVYNYQVKKSTIYFATLFMLHLCHKF